MRVLCLVVLSAGAIYAQPDTCTSGASPTPTVRNEGLSELVADIVVNCTGGTPTPAGVKIPAYNISITLNVLMGHYQARSSPTVVLTRFS